MPNIQSAIKRMRVTSHQTEVNKTRRSKVRTLIKKVELGIAGSDEKKAREFFKELEPELHRAARKGIFNLKTASRTIARLNRGIKGLSQKKA